MPLVCAVNSAAASGLNIRRTSIVSSNATGRERESVELDARHLEAELIEAVSP